MKSQSLEHAFKHDPSVAEFAVSKHAFLGKHKDAPYTLIATSALVLDTRSTSSPRILLLQRAASDSNPNKWEPPGGAVDDDDATVLHAVARELVEETGLRAARIGGPVGGSQLFKRSNGDTVCRFSFSVHVDAGKEGGLVVQLDPNEHQRFVWATEDEVRAGEAGNVELNFVPGEVKQTVLLAFKHT
ncbi:hypothetical protein B5807_02509 [Epicoccum nigrum]|jgi:8-oxo-dGTP pyrophosphatase MutT (NUDIX family)|uniref:Nudix hydrolase domain-containing protein n=1 Tax=Epicoccum nigrum TaxID=105696 RepID=A0A1Y2M9Z2_EPING|nr:hypothetical protein B5807_02509 [Epicoccum nigrum]